MPSNNRLDKTSHKPQYDRNRKKILATQDVCAWCGRPVDKTLKAPDPMSATVDHIVPLFRGGHPSDISNLQLMHRKCNLEKGTKIADKATIVETNIISNRVLPLTYDWLNLHGGNNP